MRFSRFWLRVLFCVFAAVFFFGTNAHAKRTLTITGDKVVVYSGPGKSFRPVVELTNGMEVPLSIKTTKRDNAEFYRVAIKRNGKRIVGFVATTDSVQVNDDGKSKAKADNKIEDKGKTASSESDEEVDSFAEFPLSRHAIQIAYSHFKTERAMLNVGYMRYIAPSIYTKYQVGVFKTSEATLPVLSVEAGGDSSLADRLSAYIFGAAGLFISPKADALFEGNKKNMSNFLLQGGFGVRYSFNNLAAVSLGGTQAALYSPNNSSLTFGALLTMEWPL